MSMATASMPSSCAGARVPEAIQALFRPILVHEEDPLALQVRDDRQVAMALRNRLLVHPQPRADLRRPSRQPAGHRPARDPPGFVPTDPEQRCRPADRAFLQQVNGEPLKEHRKPGSWLRPRHGDLFDAMRRALHAGNLRLNPGLQLTGIQVPPPPAFAIIP